MSQTVLKQRSSDHSKNRLASVAVALPSALLLAMLLEAALLAVGLAGDPWRDVAILAFALFLPCLWAGARIGPVLIARYDDEALRPEPPTEPGPQRAGPPDVAQQRAWQALESWCQSGMGTGRTPFWRPSLLPDVPERFSLAVMVGEAGAGKLRLADAFARHIDRNAELEALSAESRLKGLRLKLAVKWHELWWWRKRHPRQPWDCGYLVDDSAVAARLADFRPRRPTLIIADSLSDAGLGRALQTLCAAKMNYRHPVRLLVIDAKVPGVLELHFDAGTRRWQTSLGGLGEVPVIDFAVPHEFREDRHG